MSPRIRTATPQRRLGRPPGAHPEHRRVAEFLRKRLGSGVWAIHSILPSIRALARESGSSVSAVRLALRNLAAERHIALNSRRRWAVVRQPEHIATSRGTVLLVFSHPLEDTVLGSYWMELQRGVVSAVGHTGAPLLMLHSHGLQDALPEEFLDLPLQGIVLAGRFSARNLRAYERLPLPVSYLDTPTEGLRLHSVSADNAAIAYDATLRMQALGHRRIAFVRFILYTLRGVDPDASERQAGFVKAMNEAGLDATGIYSHLPGQDRQHSLLALLHRKPRYTAVLCTSTESAAMLAGEMKALGREVPRDLSLCCVQGNYDREPFSGAVLNFHDIAYRATMLLDRPKVPVIRERAPAVWRDRGSLASC